MPDGLFAPVTMAVFWVRTAPIVSGVGCDPTGLKCMALATRATSGGCECCGTQHTSQKEGAAPRLQGSTKCCYRRQDAARPASYLQKSAGASPGAAPSPLARSLGGLDRQLGRRRRRWVEHVAVHQRGRDAQHAHRPRAPGPQLQEPRGQRRLRARPGAASARRRRAPTHGEPRQAGGHSRRHSRRRSSPSQSSSAPGRLRAPAPAAGG